MNDQPIRAKIETPMSINNPLEVKQESIPLPPREMWADLDNTGGSKDEAPAAETGVVAVPSVPVRYFGNISRTEVPLEHSYVMPDGSLLTSVTVRRLTLGEVQDLLHRTAGQTLPLIEIYAEMTGLPADAIRGLDDDDGITVTGAAYDFLPRRFKDDASSET
ncbi:hypothetical protein [Rhizobium sp. S163]|uniref:hypothetical protein n=1 Tax=Rhizobium sp. S163 TaxID=3055039 RepID=UPI0025A9A907|nr:hypothetical protein [Rhizobium sp. S163]MDM9647763.1 hypothetical protein [Rhizobium sp. S163]